MIDIKRVVDEKELVKKALLKRMSPEELDLDSIVQIYNRRMDLLRKFEEKRSNQNSFNDKMASVPKGSQEFLDLIKDLKELASEVKDLEEQLREIEKELKEKLEVLPNIPDEDVVAGGKESNVVVKTEGEKPKFEFEIKDHVQLGESLGLFDFDRASKMSGSNFSMYKGMGARLEWALLNYFIDEHIKSGYEMILPPHIVGEQSGYCAGQLPKFKNDVYWLEGEDQFLIPTAETVLTNMYRDEILPESELPKKLFAYTPCYRKEAGSYRANERGLIRVHQFNKVEMYQFTTKENSEKAFEELVSKAEELVKGLGLHYQISKLAAGDCSAAAAKTYDIEVWLPAIKQYYEVSSISNVREYQSRRGNMRYKSSQTGKTEYMSTLNASGLATSRLMVAILETYQQEDGSVLVPEVLRKYIGVDKIEK
ncbi:MAG: serine--tRNA ligase [Candidatus Dojkabacteria bacterium]|jgi:seryl-tRNA synthetase|nr:serine--tRNA ligase [Candidatus Dojkabacteria bacterium]